LLALENVLKISSEDIQSPLIVLSVVNLEQDTNATFACLDLEGTWAEKVVFVGHIVLVVETVDESDLG
jgi:hypothetical protein